MRLCDAEHSGERPSVKNLRFEYLVLAKNNAFILIQSYSYYTVILIFVKGFTVSQTPYC